MPSASCPSIDLQHLESVADPAALVEAAVRRVYPGRVAVLSSFGIEAAVLLHMVAAVDPATPVLFLDTGKLFGETLRHRDRLARRLGLTDVRDVRPDPAGVAAHDADGLLFVRDADACCGLRKVEPLVDATAPFDAVLTGRKRAHGGARAVLPRVEPGDDPIKINPLAAMGPAEVAAYLRAHDLPLHPLAGEGYTSVGCYTCTTRTAPGEGLRDGRWRGQGKSECGIHLAPLRRRAG